MKLTRTMKVAAGVMTLAAIGFGGAMAGSGLATASTSPATIQSNTPAPTPEYYTVTRGDVIVGHTWRADLDKEWPVDADGNVQYPGYPNIGVNVYDANEVLIGYDTPHYGFVRLDEVERYTADPRAFVRQRAAELGIPVPEGWG